MYQHLQEWSQEGKLKKPYIDHIYNLTNYKDGFRDLARRKALGKVVIRVKEDPMVAKL